jgi:hypothetical protein
MIYILLIAFILFLVIKIRQEEMNEEMKKIALAVKKRYLELALKYDAIAFSKNKFVSVYDILGIICKESGSWVLKGLSSKDIVGDDGKSFGIMQVSEIALKDVNKSLGTDYKVEDLKIDEINIKVGAHYYELCVEQAFKEKSLNPKFLAYRKYNAGIGRAKDKNTISIDYARRVEQFIKILKEIKEG